MRIDLTVPAGAFGAYGRSIAVSGGSVYVAGYYYDSSDKAVACQWVDGVCTDLAIPAGATNAYGYSIAFGELTVRVSPK